MIGVIIIQVTMSMKEYKELEEELKWWKDRYNTFYTQIRKRTETDEDSGVVMIKTNEMSEYLEEYFYEIDNDL